MRSFQVLKSLEQGLYQPSGIPKPSKTPAQLPLTQLAMSVRVCFQALCSNSLILKSALIPAPHCIDYCNFVVSFETRKRRVLQLCPFYPQDCFGCVGAMEVFNLATVCKIRWKRIGWEKWKLFRLFRKSGYESLVFWWQ